jgi:peptidoglycan/LPS O-acetylase OafA/YrhL
MAPATLQKAAPNAGASVVPAADHIPELDGLRGLAIALVLFYHFAAEIPPNVLFLGPVEFGWSGVDLFFVLSGFLITRILLRTRQNADYFRSFYIRRALRIFPLYYAALAICAALFLLVPATHRMFPSAHDQFFQWLYLSNWIPLMDAADQRSLGHFWSLAIEEQFYWVWPLIVWRTRPARLPYVAAGAIAAAVLLRTCLYGVATDPFVYRNTLCRMDGLMIGALCALAPHAPLLQTWIVKRVRRFPPRIALLLAVGIAGSLYWHDRFIYTIGFTFFDLGFALLLLYVVFHESMARYIFGARLLRTLGKYSYGIYVIHQPVYWALVQYNVVPRGLPLLLTSLMATMLLAGASYHLMEKRFLGLKDRWTGRGSAAAGDFGSLRET